MTHPIIELQQEISRDKSLAACAASEIAAAKPIESIETEALEALSNMVTFELQDREIREPSNRIIGATF